MLDHIFMSVRNLDKSVSIYAQALAPHGIRHVVDYDGAEGPPGLAACSALICNCAGAEAFVSLLNCGWLRVAAGG